MNVATSAVNVLSLCSGYGGLDLGVECATGGTTRTVCYVEREASAAAILAARMAEETMAPAPVWSDLRTFDGRPWRGLVDLVTGGYPCQPFSHAGERLGELDERHLWPDIARVIGEVEPGIVFFENVSGHLTLGFDAVRADLARLGYRVAAGLFSAAEVGASHRRERLFILGVADTGSERSQGFGEGGSTQGSAGRGGGTTVANTDSWHRRENESKQRKVWGIFDRRSGDGVDLFPPKSANVAYSRITSTNARPESVWTRHDSNGKSSSGVDLFPPGPTDLDAWRRILAERPDLAPATQSGVCGVADGSASRLDRLRALGNGVVPLVAAYAFVSLWACVHEE